MFHVIFFRVAHENTNSLWNYCQHVFALNQWGLCLHLAKRNRSNCHAVYSRPATSFQQCAKYPPILCGQGSLLSWLLLNTKYNTYYGMLFRTLYLNISNDILRILNEPCVYWVKLNILNESWLYWIYSRLIQYIRHWFNIFRVHPIYSGSIYPIINLLNGMPLYIHTYA